MPLEHGGVASVRLRNCDTTSFNKSAADAWQRVLGRPRTNVECKHNTSRTLPGHGTAHVPCPVAWLDLQQPATNLLLADAWGFGSSCSFQRVSSHPPTSNPKAACHCRVGYIERPVWLVRLFALLLHLMQASGCEEGAVVWEAGTGVAALHSDASLATVPTWK